MENISIVDVPSHVPMYLYREPMFKVTVSTVVFVEDHVVVIETKRKIGKEYRFPLVSLRPSQESIQFAAIRAIKEHTGLVPRKDILIPVDFRSNPDRSLEGNIIDMGMVCMMNVNLDYACRNIPQKNTKWISVDFMNKKLNIRLSEEDNFYMDHELLLSRSIDVLLMVKD